MPELNTIVKSLLLPASQRFALPQSLIYFVTSRCNAACDFCLYYEHLNNKSSNHHELSADEVRRVAALYGNLHYLGISGGEPFIRKDLTEICQAFVDNCQVEIIDIPSNFYYGERMTEFVHGFLSKNKDVTLDLQFSLDNLGEKHDKSRKVNGLFIKAIKNFRSLYELKREYPNLMLKVNLVYLPSNKNELRYILNELKTLISFDRIQVTYPHYSLENKIQPQKEYIDDLKLYFEIAQEADMMVSENSRNDLYSLGLRSIKKVYRKLLNDAVTGKKNTGSYCEAGKHIAVMNETGDIFPCEILWSEKIGNVRESEYSISAILLADLYKKFREKHLGHNNHCNCTWSCAFNTEVSVNYKYFPKLAANALSLVLNSK